MKNFVLLNRTRFCLVYMKRNGLGFVLASAETYALQTLWSLAEIRWRHIYVTILLPTPSHNHDGYHHKPRFRVWQDFILAKRYYPFQKVNCIIYSKYQCKWQRWPTTIVDYTSSDQYWLLILYLCYVILAAVRCCRAAACCPFLEPLTNTLSNFLEAMACSRHNQFNRCSSLQLEKLLLWSSNNVI